MKSTSLWIIAALSLGGITSSPAGIIADDERPAALARAVDEYEESKSRARDELLEDFDLVLTRLSKPLAGLSVEDRLKLMEVVKAELKRFDEKGLIPWSLPMREGVAAYQKAGAIAEFQLRRVYDKETNRALRDKDIEEVNRLREDLETVLAPTVVAQWAHRFGAGPRRKTFYSNGRIGSPDSKATWTFANGTLKLVWPGTRAPGGAWKDTCRVSADGLQYSGKNQKGNKIGGDYIVP